MGPFLQGNSTSQSLESNSRNAQKSSQQQSGHPAYPALQQLAIGLGRGLPDLTAALEHCIDVRTSVLLDRASPRLGQLRQQRRDNKQLLQDEMDGWARRLHQQGVSELRQVEFCFSSSMLRVCLLEGRSGTFSGVPVQRSQCMHLTCTICKLSASAGDAMLACPADAGLQQSLLLQQCPYCAQKLASALQSVLQKSDSSLRGTMHISACRSWNLGTLGHVGDV